MDFQSYPNSVLDRSFEPFSLYFCLTVHKALGQGSSDLALEEHYPEKFTSKPDQTLLPGIPSNPVDHY